MQALNVQGIYNLVPHKYESQIGTASTRLRLETADPEPRHIIFRDAYLMVCVCVCCPKVDGLLKGPLALDGGHPAILSASSITQLAISTLSHREETLGGRRRKTPSNPSTKDAMEHSTADSKPPTC